MYPEDRVLVGVINRKIDLSHAKYDHWYRIPHGKAVRGIHAEYLAFFQSRAFGQKNGGVYSYARRTGHELVRRRDLLVDEPSHPRANALYYKIQLGELRDKVPPIYNPTRRPVVFIYTTWDRFMAAEKIADLYSTADYFVDRVFFALSGAGIPAERHWEASRTADDGGAQLRISCEGGEVVMTTASASSERIQIPLEHDPQIIQEIVRGVKGKVENLGGLSTAPIEAKNEVEE